MNLDLMRQFLLRNKERADTLLFFLSLLALLLFGSNEVVAAKPELLPISTANWASIQFFARSAVWLSYVAHFISYGMLSNNPWKYARQHLVELLVCLAWFPHYNTSLLHNLSHLLSVETVQLIGTVANGYVVVRHVVRNLSSHPLIVTGSAFLFVIISASQLLVQVEPQTFPNLFDAIWYSMVTTTTIGYGDIVPKTFVGRCIGMGLMVAGISLAGAFIAIISQYMQKRLGHSEEHKELLQLRERLSEEKTLNRRLVEALERDNELKTRLLEILEKKKMDDPATETNQPS